MGTADLEKPPHVKVECVVCSAPGSAPAAASAGGAGAPPARALQRRLSFHHVWEDDVAEFLHHEVTVGCRECCRYEGMPWGRVGHKPLLLAVVQGKDEDGKGFVWIARRSRKRVRQPYECPDPPPKLTWSDALSFKRHYDKPGWWVAVLFAVGSVFWLFTGIARLTKPVSMPDPWPPGIGSLSAGMSVWPELVALYLMYLPACVLQVYEATNMDMDIRQRAWSQKQGGQGPRPRPRLLPTRDALGTVSWWLAFMQLLGIFTFMSAVTTEAVGKHRLLSVATYRWAISFLFFIGGALFSGASWMATLEETGSYWRGVVPSRWSDIHSISWTAVFFALQGSLGFMIFGIVNFSYLDISWGGAQGIMVYGQVWASACFIISSVAGLLEQANPDHL